MCAHFQRWVCVPADLVGLTPERARDLIIECFSQAQHEALRQVGGPDLDSVRAQASREVRDAFARTGGDFENPNKTGLERVVEALAEKARSASTPPEIIRHHEQQVAMILDWLAD
jgi:hypothetical protein